MKTRPHRLGFIFLICPFRKFSETSDFWIPYHKQHIQPDQSFKTCHCFFFFHWLTVTSLVDSYLQFQLGKIKKKTCWVSWIKIILRKLTAHAKKDFFLPDWNCLSTFFRSVKSEARSLAVSHVGSSSHLAKYLPEYSFHFLRMQPIFCR